MRWVWLVWMSTAWRLGAQSESPPSPADAMADALARQRASVAQQREAAAIQSRNMHVWLPVGDPAAPVPPSPIRAVEDSVDPVCEPLSEIALAPILERAAKAQNLQPRLLRSVIQQESGFRPCAVSSSGAQGLMQIMPDTADELGLAEPYDPAANVEAGSKYLRQLLDRYGGDLLRALGAYNAGPTAVDRAGGIPEIPETQDYVTAIFNRLTR